MVLRYLHKKQGMDLLEILEVLLITYQILIYMIDYICDILPKSVNLNSLNIHLTWVSHNNEMEGEVMGPRRTRCLCSLPIYIENFQALLLASVLEIWCCPQLIVLVNLIYGRLSCGVTVLSGLMMVCAVCGIAVFVNAQKVSSLNYLRSPVMSSHQMILSVKKGSHRQPWIVQ